MAAIRWDNISVPDAHRNSILATAMAGKSFEGVGDNLQKILTEGKRVGDANWKNQANLNNNAAISEIQNINTLSGLQDQQANFDSGSIFDRFKAQANPETINAAVGQQENLLRERLQGPALTAYNTELGASNDPILGVKAAYNSVLAQGGRPTDAQRIADSLTEAPGAFNTAQTEDTNARRINEEVAKLQGTTAPGMSLADQKASILRDQPPTIADPIIAALEADKQAAVSTDKEQKTLNEYNTGKAALSHTAEAMQFLQSNGDIDEVKRIVNAIPDGETKLRVQAQMEPAYERLRSFTPIEQAELAATDNSLSTAYTEMLAEPNALLASTLKANELNQVIAPDRYTVLKQAGGEKGVLETLKDKTGGNGLWGVKTWASSIANDEQFQEKLVHVHKSLRDSGFTETEADQIILGTVEQSGGTTEAWSGAEGFNTSDFLTGVGVNAQRMVRFKQGNSEAIRQQQVLDYNKKILSESQLKASIAANKEMVKAKAQNRPYNPESIKPDTSGKGLKSFTPNTSYESTINLDEFNKTKSKFLEELSGVNDYDRKTVKPVPSAWDMATKLFSK